MHSRSFLAPTLLVSALALVLQTGCGPGNANGNDGGTDGGLNGIEGPSNPGSCSDGIDNDHNGYTDCADAKCVGTPACTSGALTIPDIQNLSAAKHPAANTVVQLKDEIVTAVLLQHDKNTGAAYWDAWIEEKAGGAYSGIEVDGLSKAPARGDEVDVTATYATYYGKNILQNPTTWTKVKSGATVPAPVKITSTVAGTAIGTGNNATGNKYTGVLVEVDGAKVTNPMVPGSDGYDHGDMQVDSVLDVGNLFGDDYVRTQNDTFKSLVGILDFTFSLERLQPRDDADITMADGSHPKIVDATIEQVQNVADASHPVVGTTVRLTGVVISALAPPDSKSRVNFAVADPAGGQWSGIYVYNGSGLDMSGMSVGDTVTLTGDYEEYKSTGDTDTVSEIGLKTITKTGTGTAPTPKVIANPGDLAVKATAEPWEGVLVEVDNVTVTAATDSYGETALTGGVKMGDMFYNMGVWLTNDTLSKVVGILHYNHGYIIEPRGQNDFTGSRTPPPVVTVSQIQDQGGSNPVAVGSVVEIDGAVVTAIRPPDSKNRVHFYIEDPAGGKWSGIYVYNAPNVDLSNVSVGSAVNVIGSYSEYKHLTELNLLVLKSVASGTLPSPMPVTESLFANTTAGDANGMEPYEGVLVTLTKDGTSAKMTVDAAATASGFTVDSKAATVGPTIFAFPATAGETLTSVTGVVDYFDGSGSTAAYYSVLPRTTADVVQ